MKPGSARERILARAGENLSPDRWYKPEVRPVRIGDREFLLKDYGRRSFFVRKTFGSFTIRREVAIYRALSGLVGIPECLGRVGDCAFLVERISGTDISNVRRGRLPPRFLDRLEELVRAMHLRGVIHGDLRQRKNILVSEDGQPWLIDFASGLHFPIGSPLLGIASLADRSGVAKLRQKHAPESMTREDLKLIALDRLRPLRRRRKTRRREEKDRRREARRSKA